ncbi:MAG TPA: hypothetical protein VF473_07395, partial [Cyclobacteriaceae bacterium]
ENQNVNVISGEIEQMTSKLFYNRLLDSMDLWVSYHTVGKILSSEMYKVSPFKVQYSSTIHPYMNTQIHFNFTGPEEYTLKIGQDIVTGKLNEPLKLNGLELKSVRHITTSSVTTRTTSLSFTVAKIFFATSTNMPPCFLSMSTPIQSVCLSRITMPGRRATL